MLGRLALSRIAAAVSHVAGLEPVLTAEQAAHNPQGYRGPGIGVWKRGARRLETVAIIIYQNDIKRPMAGELGRVSGAHLPEMLLEEGHKIRLAPRAGMAGVEDVEGQLVGQGGLGETAPRDAQKQRRDQSGTNKPVHGWKSSLPEECVKRPGTANEGKSPSAHRVFPARWRVVVCQNGNGALVFTAMSTLVEIQDAVARLPGGERKALQLWLNSQTELELPAEEERRLLRSLDEALGDIDAGNGTPLNDVRKRVASWAAK